MEKAKTYTLPQLREYVEEHVMERVCESYNIVRFDDEQRIWCKRCQFISRASLPTDRSSKSGSASRNIFKRVTVEKTSISQAVRNISKK